MTAHNSFQGLLPSVRGRFHQDQAVRARFSLSFRISPGLDTRHDFCMRKASRLTHQYRLPGLRPEASVRRSAVGAVARDWRLDWKTVKALEREYMRERLRRAGTPAPAVIGIDEISIRKGHIYRIVVSDLVRGRPIWFGGSGRSEQSMDCFFAWLGPRKCRKIRLAVMDMWKAFRTSTLKTGHAPQAAILYDKFHVLRHLNEALDKIRKAEYARVRSEEHTSELQSH